MAVIGAEVRMNDLTVKENMFFIRFFVFRGKVYNNAFRGFRYKLETHNIELLSKTLPEGKESVIFMTMRSDMCILWQFLANVLHEINLK